jgi:hypothetical protein
MDAQFQPIEGFPYYRVSQDGEVESCCGRRCRNRQTCTWRPLKPIRRDGGYYSVNLHRGGKKTARYVHHLVLEAFLGPRPPGMICRHLDGDSSNNCFGNLRWGTYAENEADKFIHGTRVRGSAAARSKLREEQVVEIRSERLAGVPIRQLAAHHGVSHQTIRAVVSGETWSDLLPDEPESATAHAGQQGSEDSSGTPQSAQTREPHPSQIPMQHPQTEAPQE